MAAVKQRVIQRLKIPFAIHDLLRDNHPKELHNMVKDFPGFAWSY